MITNLFLSRSTFCLAIGAAMGLLIIGVAPALGAKELVYTFEDATDDSTPHGLVQDQSSQLQHGTLYGGAQLVQDGGNGALQLNGGGAFCKIILRKTRFTAEPFSLEFNLQLDSPRDGMVMGKKLSEDPHSPGWMIATTDNCSSLIFTFSDGNNTEILQVPYSNPEEWHHVVMVRNGEAITIYLNGEAVGEKSSPVFGGDLQSPGPYFYLGKILGDFRSVNGKLDNVIIHNGRMDAQEVEEAYNGSPRRMTGNAKEHSAPVLHYRFDTDPGEKAVDISGMENHGVIGNAVFLEEAEGRKGVLRFDGDQSWLDIGNPKSLRFAGDLTLEMWVRMNRELTAGTNAWQAIIFGEYPDVGRFSFGWTFYHTLQVRYANREQGGSMLLPVERDMIDEKWAHIAVVMEYPRARFYKNGALVRDAYMPLAGTEMLSGAKFIGGIRPEGFRASQAGGNYAPIDLSEFRIYKRALSAEEVAVHARGEEAISASAPELRLEPNWYKGELTVRYTGKGRGFSGSTVQFDVRDGNRSVASEKVALGDHSNNHSKRFAATMTLPLEGLEGKEIIVTAKVKDLGVTEATIKQRLEKPEWIHTSAGHPEAVPFPWTPLEIKQNGKQTAVAMWGRTYHFGSSPFPEQIKAADEELLSAPIELKGQAAGAPLQWKAQEQSLSSLEEDNKAVRMSQTLYGKGLTVKVLSTLEYDGYLLFDCELTATEATTLDQLELKIPLKPAHAELCAASFVYKPTKKISMSEGYWNAIESDLNFLFAPSVWIGDNERGLTWQSESNEFWKNADPQQALQVRRANGVTSFTANFVDTPTPLKAGQKLHYKFALLATPVKPMLRDAWDMRVMRGGPYGNELKLPDMTVEGKPQLQFLAELGVRGMFYITADLWPWPMPIHQEYADAVTRFNKEAHAVGIKTLQYMIHTRFPVLVDEFDLYGKDMVQMPMKPFQQKGNLPPVKENPRPGPITMELGAGSQGNMMFCPKSEAVQDALMHSLNQRIRRFDDDGIYLDGTGQIMPCTNTEHGCGYFDEEGKVHPTYPVFSGREFNRRIYNTIKAFKPDGIVELHYWMPNPGQAAYADITFTGEQWHQLKDTGAESVIAELPLDRFRSMFMGYQLGTAVDLMSYRLGSTRRLAAISLLHDVPVTLNQGGQNAALLANPPAGTATTGLDEANYFRLLPQLWRMRDRFEIGQAKKHFYWENQGLVTLSPANCYATLFRHPQNGVLAVVSNLTESKAQVGISFNLESLGLSGQQLEVFDVFTKQPIPIENGKVIVPLASEDWTYIWLKPIDS